MTDPAAQGRANRAAGQRWMQRIARDLSLATGLEIKRQLLEVREGTLGDIEIHPRLPFLIEAKNSERPSIWAALGQIEDLAEEHQLAPIAVLQKRQGKGGTNIRVAAWYLEDWQELAEQLSEFGLMRLPVIERKESPVYPRVWDGLEEAREELQEPQWPETSFPVCFGHRKDGKDIVLQTYDSWLWMIKTAVVNDIW